MIEEFLALSRVLTGVATLNVTLGAGYLERLLRTPHEPLLRQCLGRFKDATATRDITPDAAVQQLLEDAALRPILSQIVLLWYTSALQDNPATPNALRYGSEEEYFSGLGWQLIGAHVPGLSGGHFGHWRYRP